MVLRFVCMISQPEKKRHAHAGNYRASKPRTFDSPLEVTFHSLYLSPSVRPPPFCYGPPDLLHCVHNSLGTSEVSRSRRHCPYGLVLRGGGQRALPVGGVLWVLAEENDLGLLEVASRVCPSWERVSTARATKVGGAGLGRRRSGGGFCIPSSIKTRLR